MVWFRGAVIAAPLLALSAAPVVAEPAVMASIKPVHSLVAAVMQGVGTPELIVDGAGSPHTYALKPSQARQLQQADLIFWVGPELEAFLEKPIQTTGRNARSVALLESDGLVTRPFREGGAFDDHDHDHDDAHGHDDAHAHDKHDDHAHKKHDDHAHKKHDDHAHDDQDDHAHDDQDDHAHDHDGLDPHVWLDPRNAQALVRKIAQSLSEADPRNAARYNSNAADVIGRLEVLEEQIQASLIPVRGRGFIVFHDAYRYFEDRFGLTAIGSITISPEVMPGAERLGEVQEKVRTLDASCVFAEPQFEPKLVSVVVDGTAAKIGVLDPLGAALENGPTLYFDLIRSMAVAFRDCLS